ncbi:antirestriction protein ArdR [Salmonella enterica]
MIGAIRKVASQWRDGNQENPGGVVLIWQGAVYGWKNELRDANHERPGAYAVDVSGQVFIAEGGDEYNGAERWAAAQPKTDR